MKVVFSTAVIGFFKKLFITQLLLILGTCLSYSAYLRNVPQTLTQPDGTVLHCYASGDEYYNWLHDKDGYTIVADPNTGYYVYAEKVNGELVAGRNIAGKVDPATLGIDKWLKIAAEKIKEKAKALINNQSKFGRNKKSETIQVSGTINNIVIFIRFSDESEFTDPISTYDNIFNNTGSASMKSYFMEASYNQVTVNSSFYPIPGATVLSYQDSHVRNYYKPYNASTNPIGYTSGNRTTREHTLLKDAVNAVKSQIPSGLNIDSDGDGYVDNVCFVVYGAPGGWSDLLWPHKWVLYSYNVTINSKVVWDYNLQLQTVVDAGVLCHEMFHTFGSPDLYHYSYDGKTPVGGWDLMEYDNNPPEHMGAYMKYKYGNWISSIPLISLPGTYQLNPLTSSTNNCYRINSPNAVNEYFVVEYRKKTGTFESSIPGTGLLVYRINTTVGGNQDGPPDEVYIYRPNGTPTTNGTISQANYSADLGRTVINDLTNPSCFLTDGSNGGLILYDVSSPGSTISFKIGFGVVPPTLKSPANASDGVTITPLLVWYKSLNAVTYDLQVSAVSNFSSTLINLTGLTDTTYQISSPLSKGIRYYWRVKVHTSIDTSDWSSTWDFRTIVGAPSLVSPTDNAHSLDTTYTFSWISVFGADTYRLQISTTANFTNIVKNISNITGSTSEVSGLSYSAKYYWRVNASNAGGTGDWSNVWSFTTIIGPPNLIFPVNEAKRISDSGFVMWNQSQIAVNYRIQISRFPDFSVNVYDQSNVTDTIFSYQGLEFGTIYFWRASSTSQYDVSNWSPSWNFTTILGPPNLLYPQEHSTGIPDTGTFKWLSVNQAQTYNLQVSTDSTFGTTDINQMGISGANKNYSGLNNNTKYYWRVEAHNNDGDGKWSEVRDFTTQLEPPVLIQPSNSATGVPDSGQFRWNAVWGAANYKIMASTDADFTTQEISDSTLTGTSYTYKGLEKSQIYYWRVRGKSANNTGEWSETWNFTTSFDAPALIYPSDNATGIPKNIRFRWQSVNGAGMYHIRVSAIQDFSAVLIEDSTLAGNTFDFGNLGNSTRYYWQVRAKKGSAWSNWSSTWNFSTTLSAPLLTAPPDGNSFVRVSGTLNWEPVSGAVSYKINLSKFSNFNPAIINDSSISGTSYDYSGLDNNTKYYWRVAGKNSGETGNWSEVWNFTTRIATPELLAPADNAIKVQNNGKLRWNPVEGAVSYNVQLSTAGDFANKIIDQTAVTNTYIDFVNLGLETDYYWRVSAANTYGTTDWTATRKFTTDKYSSVNDGEFISGLKLDIYPNPVGEKAVLEISNEYDSNFEISIINILGEKTGIVYSGFFNRGKHRIEWNTSQIPSGLYFVELTNGMVILRKAVIIN